MVQIPLIAPGFPETAQRVGIKFQASVPLAPITPHVEQLWFENQAVISTANALAAAVPKMTAGDVLLVESSSTVLHPKFGLLPAEVDPVVFDLI
jgi:hypothetical protein